MPHRTIIGNDANPANNERAIEDFDEAIRLDPKDDLSYNSAPYAIDLFCGVEGVLKV